MKNTKLENGIAIDHSGGNECHLLGMDRDLVPTCKRFVRKCCCVVIGFVSCILI